MTNGKPIKLSLAQIAYLLEIYEKGGSTTCSSIYKPAQRLGDVKYAILREQNGAVVVELTEAGNERAKLEDAAT